MRKCGFIVQVSFIATARVASFLVSPIAKTKKLSSAIPRAARNSASFRGGSSSDSSVSSKVPQCTPSERLAPRSSWICSASSTFTCCALMNQRGS